MNNKQLNNLVISYQESKDELVAKEIHEIVTSIWERGKVLHSLAWRYGVEIAEVESLANFLLYEKIKTYEHVGDFYNLLSVSLSRRCINIRRDHAKFIDNEISLESSVNDEDDENPLIKFLVAANAEDEAVENLQRKSDQRQLIASLIDKAPEKCRQALKAYIESDYSYTKAAKLIGVKYDTVKRRVENIANYFDPNKFGQVSDYFTEPTQRTA